MQHTVGRRRGRRRISVAVLTTAMTLAALRGRHRRRRAPPDAQPPARAQMSRARGNFDIRARGGAAVAPSARTARARVDLAQPFGHPGRDRVGSADRHAPDGRATGRLPDGTQQAPREGSRHRLCPIEPHGLRIDHGRPQDVPPATGLRGHRGRASHLVDAGQAWRAGVPQRPPRGGDERRAPAQRHRLAGARHPRRVGRSEDHLRCGDQCGTRRRRRDGRRRAELRLGVARAVPDGTRRSTRMEDVHLAEHATAQHVGGGRPERVRCSTGRASPATTPEPRRRGSSTRATWFPRARTWRTPSRSRSSTARN